MLSHRSLTLAALAVAALSASACTGKDQPAAPVTLTRLEVAPAAAGGVVASVGVPVQFTATGTYSDGSSGDLTATVAWSSSNPAAATFSGDPAVAGLLTPATAGSADVTATHPATGLQATVTVSVVPAALALLEIAPIDPTILVGTTLQLDATGTLADESVVSMTSSVVWTSSEEGVAAVSPTALATAVSVGSTAITATDPVTGTSDTILFTVTDVPAALAYVTMSRGSVVGGSSVQVIGTVVLTSYAAEPVPVTLWTSDVAVTVPESVVVPAGSPSASFDVIAAPVTHRTRVFVYATDGTSTKRARLNVRAAK